MRLLLTLVSASFAMGCVIPEADERALAGLDQEGPPAPHEGCALDSDCQLVASSCCECPSYALPAGDSAPDACVDVGCQPEDSCPVVEAACDGGTCVMRCAPVVCELSCAAGFVADALGCLTCACAENSDPGVAVCASDPECVQVAADCCGCAQGGADIAVHIDQVASHLEALDCTGAPACPGLDSCDPSLQPRCAAGSCQLLESAIDAPAGPEGDGWCGRPGLQPCPQGTVCVLNDSQANDATLAGVGICRGA